MGSIVEAVGSPEFLAGLRWGGITGTAALLVGIAWRRWRQQPAAVAGLAAIVAAALAMSVTRPLSPSAWAGLGLLALAGAIFPWTRRIPFLPVLMAVPGAWLIGRSGLLGPGWVTPLVIVVIALSGPVISWFDDNADASPVPSLLFSISAVGVWVTLPDTEEARVLLGAMTVPTLLAWPLRLARLGAVGGHALVGLFLWVIAWGGRGRQGSVIGAALGMLAVAPIASWLARRQRVTTTGWIGFSLLLVHAALVAYLTRVAGLKSDPVVASWLALPALAAATLLWVTVERSIGHAPRSDRQAEELPRSRRR